MSSTTILLAACLALAFSCVAAEGNRRMLSIDARESKEVTDVSVAEGRELYIDNSIKPTGKNGWNVVISITCNGKYSTVNNIKLRSALSTLGFSSSPNAMSFGGNAATTNWRSITQFTVNIPSSTSSSDALAKAAVITVAKLNAIANLPKINPVVGVVFAAYKA